MDLSSPSDRRRIGEILDPLVKAIEKQPQPVDLTPVADALRDGLQSIGAAIEYAAQINQPPFNARALALELIKIVDEEDAK